MAAMKIVCLAVGVLVASANAYFPNMQQMTQGSNMGMNSNPAAFGQRQTQGFNYNSGASNVMGQMNQGMGANNHGMSAMNPGIGAMNPGITGVNPGMHTNTLHQQANQQAAKAKQGGPVSDMLSMLFLTKGAAALNDPNMKTMALVAMMNGENLPQHVVMALSGQNPAMNPMMNPLAPGGAKKAPAGEPAEGGVMNQIFDMMLLQQLNSGSF